MPASHLSIEGVSKEFDSRGKRALALDSVDLAVNEGEFVTIVGASGCGTSALNLTAGLDGLSDRQAYDDGRRPGGVLTVSPGTVVRPRRPR